MCCFCDHCFVQIVTPSSICLFPANKLIWWQKAFRLWLLLPAGLRVVCMQQTRRHASRADFEMFPGKQKKEHFNLSSYNLKLHLFCDCFQTVNQSVGISPLAKWKKVFRTIGRTVKHKKTPKRFTEETFALLVQKLFEHLVREWHKSPGNGAHPCEELRQSESSQKASPVIQEWAEKIKRGAWRLPLALLPEPATVVGYKGLKHLFVIFAAMRLRLIWTNAGEKITLAGHFAACFFTCAELRAQLKRPSENTV